MNRDDPFAEPSDTDKTIIRPNPSGRVGTPIPARPAAPRPNLAQAAKASEPEVALTVAQTGMNPLIATASPLFMLVGRIRNRAQHANPDQLRESTVVEIRAFENNALQAGVSAQSIKVARYALCATVDDVVLNTPWGGQSIWAQQSMVGTFHKETRGGDRFFDLLERLQADPSTNRELLEFLYMCLSLGFEGRLRVADRGSEKHLTIRDGLARAIRTYRGPIERDLSPNWKGISLAHKAVSAWMPVWIFCGLTAGAMAVTFFGFSFALGIDSERLRGQLLALNVNGPVELARAAPPPPAPPPSVQEVADIERLRTFLAPEIEQGLVSVLNEGNAITVRITGTGLFGSGSDVLSEDAVPTVDRVAAALNGEEGRIIVAGHSDNIPINTARFPSNVFLSLARAQAVMDQITGTLADPTRISAEGRAESEPIASNDTREGRAQNRRIDVILVKAG